MGKPVTEFRQLWVYRTAFQAAMELYEESKSWPAEERYALTDQVRRASRSVCANMAEGWRKRCYPKHFVSKLSDADAEVAEVQNWLLFAFACGYITKDRCDDLNGRYQQVAAGLSKTMSQAGGWAGERSVHDPSALYGSVI